MRLNEEEQEKHQKQRKDIRWGRVILAAGLGIVALITWAYLYHYDFSPSAESIPKLVARVNADASYECPETLAILATTSRPCTVTIRNREDRLLTGVTLSINGEYTFRVGSPGIGSRDTYSVDLEEFVKDDGTRFNFVSTRILSMSLRSNQGSTSWTFE